LLYIKSLIFQKFNNGIFLTNVALSLAYICVNFLYMKLKFLFSIFMLIIIKSLYAQDTLQLEKADDKYLEDQFYAGITYNLVMKRPSNSSQNNFSNGIQLGYIKDIPFHTKTNKGFGIGLGYAVNSYYTNLRASKIANDIEYEVIASSVSYRRNKIETHLVEIPMEFRWRTSTAKSYKFWRIYTGVKWGYVFANVSKYIENHQKEKFFNPDIQRFQYGLYVSFGYNTWNFYANYQLSPILKEGTLTMDGEGIRMNALNIGLIFYIL
jgi:Outer membrane protein beta-barrel domain